MIQKIAALTLMGLAVSACGSSAPVSYAEASEALTEASNESQAETLTSNTIEISTNFTIGMGVQNAVTELKSFIETELPCATITLNSPTLTVEYGTHGVCLYRGQTISGTQTITVMKDDDSVEVQHTWTNLTNGKVTVSGTATATWSKTDKSRHIQYQLHFTRLSDGVAADGSGDVVQKVLDPTMAISSPTNGLQIDGNRTWKGPKGTWTLTADAVQLRWKDPMPFSGSFVLDTPAGKTITLTFERLDDTTIEATLEGGRKTWKFKVHETGAIDSTT